MSHFTPSQEAIQLPPRPRWSPGPAGPTHLVCEAGDPLRGGFRAEIAFSPTTSKWRWDVWEYDLCFGRRFWFCGGYEVNIEVAQREAEAAIADVAVETANVAAAVADVAVARAKRAEALAAAYHRTA